MAHASTPAQTLVWVNLIQAPPVLAQLDPRAKGPDSIATCGQPPTAEPLPTMLPQEPTAR